VETAGGRSSELQSNPGEKATSVCLGEAYVQNESGSGDFARVCYHEISARSTVEEGQLSIEAVNSLLDQLATGRLKQSEYVPILRKINQQCTAVEQEWIVRIILKG
jgi:DNA ligase-4